ncbi:unnamed protein product, partial [Polarella glacialis]
MNVAAGPELAAAVVDKLHAAGIPVMNMVGAPKHAQYAIEAGVDLICAQGGEGGGRTGDVATSILIPKVVDICRGHMSVFDLAHMSPLTGEPILMIAAGGIFDGRGLAMSLSLGARAPPRHKKGVVAAGFNETRRTTIYSGRPMRCIKTSYIDDWEDNQQQQIKELTAEGTIPAFWDMETRKERGLPEASIMDMQPMLCGAAAAAITEILPAAAIMDEMISGAIVALRSATSAISKL